MQGAAALPIQCQVLAEALAHQHLKVHRSEVANSVGVFVEPITQTLICDVEQGDVLSLLHSYRNLVPLLLCGISSRRVVAACLEYEDTRWRCVADGSKNGRDVDCPLERVKVGICVDFKTDESHHGFVVAPCWCAHVDLGQWRDGCGQEQSCEMDGARARYCLYRCILPSARSAFVLERCMSDHEFEGFGVEV